MSTAPKYIPYYTVDDYRQWQGDWELWQGIPVAMTPNPFFPHQELGARLASSLLAAVEAANCCAAVAPDVDWIVSQDTVVRPDVLLVCGDRPQEHVTTVPALVIEILSASTAIRDRNEKQVLYEENGVEYYLIVDPNEKSVVAYRRSESGGFEEFDASGECEYYICDDCRIRWDVTSSLG